MLAVNDVTFSYSAHGEEDAPPALRAVSLKIDAGGEGLLTIRQRVGLVYQNPDDQLVANSVIDDIAFGPENLGLPRFEIEERVQEAMALLDLEPYAQMAVNEISVGQKQRVTIAGVLAMRPRYLLLDEPTTMISGHTARQLLETVQRLSQERGISAIHITHFMHEATSFKRVIVMDAGRVLMDGTPAEVFARADELRAVGLDVPMVTRLSQRLRAQGWTELPEVVLSTEQLNGAGHLRASPPGSAGMSLIDTSREVTPAPAESKPLFELRDVHHTYLRGTPFAVEALRGLSLSVTQGQTVALVGPTKAGKSTVVDVLAGLIKPAPGTFFFAGSDVGVSSFDIERIRSMVGTVFQSPEAQIFEDTVGKDVSFGPRLQKVPLAESRRLVQDSLEAVGLPYEDFRSRYTYALSGGQKRRVAIAGVLALQPKVIIFDEPAAGLDPRGRRELLELIARLKRQQALTIIYISSGLDDVIDLADFIYILDQGQLTLSGTSREILTHAQELSALDIELPEAAKIALALREAFPAMRTDIVSLAELEEEIALQASPTPAHN